MKISQDINILVKKGHIQKIVEHYSKESGEQIDKSLLQETIKKLMKNSNKLDIGQIYINNISYNKRKLLGEIYTPKRIVNYILDLIKFKPGVLIHNKRIIDLSCGSGSFLIQAVNRLKSYYKTGLGDLEEKNNQITKVKSIIKTIAENIYGIDINPIACILCQININMALIDLYQYIWDFDKTYNPPVFKIYNLNSFNLNSLNDYIDNNSFDYVIGNPPYLFIRSISSRNKELIKSNDFETNSGQYDSYQLFIELGIRYLRNNGLLGYIIPDSILALSNRAIIRRYIYENTKLKAISIVGEQFENSVVSNIILILQKEQNKKKRNENIIHINKFNGSIKSENKIEQSMLKQWNYRYLINLTETDATILSYLNASFPKLEDLMEMDAFNINLGRGVELTKEGEIFFCNSCEKFYPVPRNKNKCINCGVKFGEKDIEKIIFTQKPKLSTEYYAPYLYTLRRYKIKDYKYIITNKSGINYKNLSNYEDRVIIRQLNQGNLICASYFKGLMLCSQSYYNLKVKDSPNSQFDNIFMLGLLNSHLLSFYFIKSFSSYKKLFKRILIQKLKELPIKVPRTQKESQISNKLKKQVEKLLYAGDIGDNEYKETQAQIDEYVYELYEIDENYRSYIKQYFKEL